MGDNEDQGIERNGPAYRPRDFCLRREHFGRVDQAEFRQSSSEAEAVLIDAARMQHDIAYRVWSALIYQGRTQDWLAKRMNTSLSRVGRLLRGEVPMRIVDVASIARALQLTFL